MAAAVEPARAAMVQEQQLPVQGHCARAEDGGAEHGREGQEWGGHAEPAVRTPRAGGAAARRRQRRRHPHGHPPHHAQQRHQGGPPPGHRREVPGAVAPEASHQHDARRRVHLRGVPRVSAQQQPRRLLARAVGARPPAQGGPGVVWQADIRMADVPAAPHPRVPALPVDPQDHALGGRPRHCVHHGIGTHGRRPALGHQRCPRQPPRVVGARQDRGRARQAGAVLEAAGRDSRPAHARHRARRLVQDAV
mmetsp:Transcript_16821/g.50419  ORF Transcript_16821/g.50419 Transcript_16821/m.50419 type:complete len:250 (+) Transcript_16821:585-1334(+)